MFSLLTKIPLFFIDIVVDTVDLLLVSVYFEIDGKISSRTLKKGSFLFILSLTLKQKHVIESKFSLRLELQQNSTYFKLFLLDFMRGVLK